MASGLRLITTNPVTGSLERQEQRAERESLAETRDWERANKEAERINERSFAKRFQDNLGMGGQPQTTEQPSQPAAQVPQGQAPKLGATPQPSQPAAPQPAAQPRMSASQAAARAALATPGMGYKGAEMMISAEQSQDEIEREQMKTVLETAKTDPATALALMQQWGIDMPEAFKSLLGDRAFVSQMKQVLEQIEAQAKAQFPNEVQRARYIEKQMERATAQLVGQAHARAQGGAPAAAGGDGGQPQRQVTLRDVIAGRDFGEQIQAPYREQDVVWVDNLAYTRDQSGSLIPFNDPRTGRQMEKPPEYQTTTDRQGNLLYFDQRNPVARQMRDEFDQPVTTKAPYTPPEPKAPQTFVSNGYLYRWEGTRAVPVLDDAGNHMKADATNGKGGKSVWQTKYDAWLAQHPGDTKGALDYAVNSGGGISPPELRKFAYKVAEDQLKAEAERSFREDAITTEEIESRANGIFQYIRGGDGTQPPQQGQQQNWAMGMQGDGSQQSPFMATTQEQVDSFKANAPNGAYITVGGKTYQK